MKPRIACVVLILMLTALACNMPAGPTVQPTGTSNPMLTMVAGTLQANPSGSTTPTSALALVTPGVSSATPSGPVATATNTRVPPTATSQPCDNAAFIQDVTIPDNTKLVAGQTFTKTWRLRNIGTCTWNKYYAIVFIDGHPLGAPAVVNLTGEVSPNQDVDLSVNMVAPTAPGKYTSNWKLRNPTGMIFGAPGNTAFYTQIEVVTLTLTPTISLTPTITQTPTITTTPTRTNTPSGGIPSGTVLLDFVSAACKAQWRSEAGVLPCYGAKGDTNGYVLNPQSPKLESGTTETQPVLLTAPQNKDKGVIAGVYPSILIESGLHFQATIGCLADATGCSVMYQLNYIVDNGQPKNLQWWTQAYDGSVQAVDVDLSSLAGKNASLILVVVAQGTADQAQAVWVNPRVTKR